MLRAKCRVRAWAVATAVVVGVVAAPVLAQAGPIVVGLPADSGQGNVFPFGTAYPGEYQQVYTKSVFPGAITITALKFYNTQLNSGTTQMTSGTWDISLSTTSADWNTLSSTYASNIGADHVAVFSGNLSQPWAFGNTLLVTLSTPFTYDPAIGNLLMDVFVSGASSSGPIYFDTNGINNYNYNGNTIMGRVYTAVFIGGSSVLVNDGFGLVTGFETGSTEVPEPASLLLLDRKSVV
jgi:hypothetical protein